MIGTIFEDKNGGYWKVSGPARNSYGNRGRPDSYPVIKCTKYGREYQRTNGFTVMYVDNLVKEGKTWKATDNTEASTDGQARGILKRRVTYLESRIASDTEELNRLIAQLTKD